MADRRKRSKQLFGNSYMLEVCLEIARGPARTNQQMLIGRKAISPSVYTAPIKRLRDLELLLDAPRGSDDRRERWYTRAPSSLWQLARELGQ